MSALGVDLQGLYDCARIVRELGMTRKCAEKLMQGLPQQHVPGLAKRYVRAGDLQKRLDENLRRP